MQQVIQTCLKPIGGWAKQVSVEEYKKCFARMLEHGPGLEHIYQGRPIGVAVSGGPDSTALLMLTKKAFPNVPIKTYMIDHAMEDVGVTEEPNRVSTLLANMEIDCKVIRLSWEDAPLDKISLGKRLITARDKRYSALLDACLLDNVGLILLGHNLDDDIVTLFYRMARFSGLDGMSGMRPLSSFPVVNSNAANVLLGRPLLKIEKSRLLKTCIDMDLQYTNDASNNVSEYSRNLILSTLSEVQSRHADNPSFDTERLELLLRSFKNHHRKIHDQVVSVMNESVFVNKKHGTAVIIANNHQSLEKNRPVWFRVLSYLFQYVAVRQTPARTTSLNEIITKLADASKESQCRLDKKKEMMTRMQQIATRQFKAPALPSNKTGRIHIGMQVSGGCVVYPLARADAALRIEAARKESGRQDVEYGPSFLVQREKFKGADAHPAVVQLKENQEYLWDGRFFLSYKLLNKLNDAQAMEFEIRPLRPEDCKDFQKSASSFGSSMSKRLLQAFQAVTPGVMLYNVPVIRAPSIDPEYICIPCVDIHVGSRAMPPIVWTARHAGEGFLIGKFRCLP